MSSELKIGLDPFNDTGLTLLGRITDAAGLQVGLDISMTEGANAVYIGDVSLVGFSDGEYVVQFLTLSPNALYGYGSLYIVNETDAGEGAFNAAQQQQLTDIEANTTRVDGLIEDVGGDRYTTKALENASGGGGGGDWTTGEKENIRYRLGIDGDTTKPAVEKPDLAQKQDIFPLL